MRFKLLAPVLVVLPFLLPGCGVINALEGCRADFQRPNIAALTNDLAAARLRWQAANIQDYSYTFDQFAAPVGFPTAKITVKAGKVVSTTAVNPQPNDPPVLQGQTMERQFDQVANWMSGGSTGTCHTFSAAYDATDGHPLRVDSGTALKNIEDGFGSLVYSNFTRP